MDDRTCWRKERTVILPLKGSEFADWLEAHLSPTLVPISEDSRHYLSIGQFRSPTRGVKPGQLAGHMRLSIYGAEHHPDPDCEDASVWRNIGDLIVFTLFAVENRTKIEVHASCSYPDAMCYFDELLAQIGARWPDSSLETRKAPRTLGIQGGTLDRVHEVYDLIGQGMRKTRACRRVGIDPRTYDNYVTGIVDWEPEE